MTLPMNQFMPSAYVSAILPEGKPICIHIQGESNADKLASWLNDNGGAKVQVDSQPHLPNHHSEYSFYINRATHPHIYRDVIDPITGFVILDEGKNPGSHYCKTSKEIVAKIRQLLATNSYQQVEVARLCGVAVGIVSMVKTGHKRFKDY